MSDVLLVFTKLVLAVVLFPVAWAAGAVFHRHMMAIPGPHDEFFYWGMFGFLMVNFFFYRFDGIYEIGQKIMTGVFKFMQPANQYIARVIPFYVTVIFTAFYVSKTFFGIKRYDHYFMFFAGFTFIMHLIMTARDLQEEESSFLKPSYLLVMVIVFTVFMCVVTLLYNLAAGAFTFPDYIIDVKDTALDFYYAAGQKILFQR